MMHLKTPRQNSFNNEKIGTLKRDGDSRHEEHRDSDRPKVCKYGACREPIKTRRHEPYELKSTTCHWPHR